MRSSATSGQAAASALRSIASSSHWARLARRRKCWYPAITRLTVPSAAVDPVSSERDEHGVLLVTLNHPDRRNAIDGAMADALRAAFEAAADDGEVRAVILTGAGGAFSAGGDLSRFERDWDPREFRHDSHRLTSLISLVERLEKPTVAAINGVATGAGTQLALACDVRLMAAGTRFVYREGRLGIIPSHGGITRLVKLIGLARARDVLLGGEEVSADDALRLGLVTAVVEPEALAAARERLELMLARSPQAYAAAKRLLWLAAN